MKIVEAMLLTHPAAGSGFPPSRVAALEALAQCEQVCLSCADACLGEYSWEDLRPCVRLSLDCAAVCSVTIRLAVRQIDGMTEMVRAQLQACVAACRCCAEICAASGTTHHYCGICATTCRDCLQKCEALRNELSDLGVLSTN